PRTTRRSPYGVYKTTTKAWLGQPVGTLSGARVLSPSQRGGLPACVVFAFLPLPSAAGSPSHIAVPREAQTPDARLSPPVGRAIRPSIEALRLRYRRPNAWQDPHVHGTSEHSFRRITWRIGERRETHPGDPDCTGEPHSKAWRWPVSQSQRLQAFQNMGAEINRYGPVISI